MKKLTGSKKQIKWAKDIRLDILSAIDESLEYTEKSVTDIEQKERGIKHLSEKKKNILEMTMSTYFIDNRSDASSIRNILKIVKHQTSN